MVKLLLILSVAVGVLSQQPPGRTYLPPGEADYSRVNAAPSPQTDGGNRYGDAFNGASEGSQYRAPSGESELLNDVKPSQQGVPSGNLQPDDGQFAQYNAPSGRPGDVSYPSPGRDSSFEQSRYPSSNVGGENAASSAYGEPNSQGGYTRSNGPEDFSAPSNRFTNANNQEQIEGNNIPSSGYNSAYGRPDNAPISQYRPQSRPNEGGNSAGINGFQSGDRSSGLNAPSSAYGAPGRDSSSDRFSGNGNTGNSPPTGAVGNKYPSPSYGAPSSPVDRAAYNQVGGGNSYQKGGANEGYTKQSGNLPSPSYADGAFQSGSGANNPSFPSGTSPSSRFGNTNAQGIPGRTSSAEDLEGPQSQSGTPFGIQVDDPSSQSAYPSPQNGENTPSGPSTRYGSSNSQLSDDSNVDAYQYRAPQSAAFVGNSDGKSGTPPGDRFGSENAQSSRNGASPQGGSTNDPAVQTGASFPSNRGGNFQPQNNDISTQSSSGRDRAQSGAGSVPFPDGGARTGGGDGGAASGRGAAPFPDGGARPPVSPAAETVTSRSAAGIDPQFKPADYEFSYQVSEPLFGNDFGHHERRVQDFAQGEYYVLLPDGRTQVVEYEADKGGYRPMIHYEGLRGIRGKFARLITSPGRRPLLG